MLNQVGSYTKSVRSVIQISSFEVDVGNNLNFSMNNIRVMNMVGTKLSTM